MKGRTCVIVFFTTIAVLGCIAAAVVTYLHYYSSDDQTDSDSSTQTGHRCRDEMNCTKNILTSTETPIITPSITENPSPVNRTCENVTVSDIFRVELGCDALKNISYTNNTIGIAKEMFKNFFFTAYTGGRTRNDDESRKRRNAIEENIPITKEIKDKIRLTKTLMKTYEIKRELQKWKNVLNDPDKNPDAVIDFIAEKVWERTGAKLVEKIIKSIAVPLHSLAGGYVGGAVGMGLAVIFPPATIALVVGGVFFGRALGAQIGEANAKIASDLANERLLRHAITPLVKESFREELILLLDELRDSPETICSSDICPMGYAEIICKCTKCDGAMGYSDRKGLPTCKSCTLGSIPLQSTVTTVIDDNTILNNDQIHIGCEPCPKMEYGKNDGKCYKCDSLLQYTNQVGSTKCQECKLGSFVKTYLGYSRCEKCPCMTFGDENGECHECEKRKYSDPGSSQCKQCPARHMSFQRWGSCSNANYGCWPCTGYSVLRDNKCELCDGRMEYNDVINATDCKTCPLGSYSLDSISGCFKCPLGTYGTEDGYCRTCSGPLAYADEKGLAQCKTCSLGMFSHRLDKTKCSKCYIGTKGTKNGCVKCDGPMDYSDIEGATQCKTCSLGTVATGPTTIFGPDPGHQKCEPCPAGTYGIEGKCERCNGENEYNDVVGATSCKQCPTGTKPIRSRRGCVDI